MNPLKPFWYRIRSLWQRRKVKREIDEELRFHLEQRVAENVAAGMSPEEAAREARKRFGNMQSVREECRETRGANFGEAILQDARFGLRMLRKHRGFTGTAVFILALGIGANTAIFSVVNAVLLRPLQYPESGQLVTLRERNMELGFSHFSVAPGTYLDWQKQNHVFESLAALADADFNLTGLGQPERVHGMSVTASYFPTLRIQPELGRLFRPDEDAPGQEQVVVLKHSFWQKEFGGDADIIGKRITLDGTSCTVIGVADQLGAHYSFWVPLALSAEEQKDQAAHWLRVIGRLKPGMSLEQARANLNIIALNLQREYPEPKRGWTVLVDPLLAAIVAGVRPALMLLFGAVGLVLLIVCANIAGLLLARASSREREMAIRAALGAGRGRLIRQFLTESVLLGMGGGLGGVLTAWAGLAIFRAVAPGSVPRMADIRLDGWVLGFALAASLVTGIIFGLVPAWQAGRKNLVEPLKHCGRGLSSGRNRHLLRGGLVIAEIALSLVLLVDAGLTTRSFIRVATEPTGYNASHVVAMDIGLPRSKYPSKEAQAVFFDALVDQVGHAPGVESAGAVSVLPLHDLDSWDSIEIPGRASPPATAAFFAASPNYLQTMQIPLAAGRFFTGRDREASPRVAIVNQTFARTFFPQEEALGRQIKLGGDTNLWEIVGLIQDVKTYSLEDKAPAEVYVPHRQWGGGFLSVVLRTQAETTAAARLVRGSVFGIDHDQPIQSVTTMDQLVARSTAGRRSMTILMGTFAVVALVLCASGLYGLVSFTVAERTREFGIRMALGARRRDVVGLVLRQGTGLAAAGLGLGLAGAVATTRLLAGQLYGVEAHDWSLFALGIGLLLAVTALAMFVPAWRATQVDPMAALRHE